MRTAICIAALMLGTAAPVFAQSMLNLPGASQAPMELPAASASAAVPAPEAAPVVAQLPPPQINGRPAPGPAIPPGGAMPNRAVDQTLERAASTAASRLQSISPEGMASADVSAIGGELESMAAKQRRVRSLILLNREADETKKLYTTLYGADSMIGQNPNKPPPSAAPQVTEAEINKRVEERVQQALAAQQEAKRKEAAELAAVRPVVASIYGTGRKRNAIVLVPYVGEVKVQVGSKLTETIRVVAISERGVEVTDDGVRSYLGFGDSVPRIRPPSAVGPVAAGGGVPYTINSSPLPVSGGQRLPGMR